MRRTASVGMLWAALGGQTWAEAPAPPRVEIDSGVLEGGPLEGREILAFKGVPYAASPAGAARWRPPQPPARWPGVRSAREEGSACPQPDRESANFKRLTAALDGDPSRVPPLAATSEDCLFLNVFTASLDRRQPRPVLVWVHGGANRFGSGKDQAAALAHHGVVVVTFNYRLGLLGFLAHPALSRESPHGSSGNYALLDQIEALRWVQRNIAAFGGDRHRVTVMGHSAGGDSVAQLLASPLAEGLFHRAVIQSGGLGTSRPRAEMEAEGSKIAAALGAPAQDPLPTLRTLPVERLVSASHGPFDAMADGWVVPVPGPGALAPGAGATLPLLVGATADEARAFGVPPDLRQAYQAMVDETGPAWKERVAALYPAGSDEQLLPTLQRLSTERDFVCPARHVAARRRGPTWLYLFSSPAAPGPAGKRLGAFHGVDVRLLFGATYGVDPGPAGEKLGEAMRRYWALFAATGDPNGAGLPAWPAYGRTAPAYLELADPIRAREGLGGAGCDLFDQVWGTVITAGSARQ